MGDVPRRNQITQPRHQLAKDKNGQIKSHAVRKQCRRRSYKHMEFSAVTESIQTLLAVRCRRCSRTVIMDILPSSTIPMPHSRLFSLLCHRNTRPVTSPQRSSFTQKYTAYKNALKFRTTHFTAVSYTRWHQKRQINLDKTGEMIVGVWIDRLLQWQSNWYMQAKQLSMPLSLVSYRRCL